MTDVVGGAGADSRSEAESGAESGVEEAGAARDEPTEQAETTDTQQFDAVGEPGSPEAFEPVEAVEAVEETEAIEEAEATEAIESVDADEPEGGRGTERTVRRARRRRRIKVALLAVTTTTAVGAATIFGLAAWDIQHLTHNLKHTTLLPSGFTEPAEPVDAYGRSPINILLIGSDTRDTSADCSLGGACTQGASNAGANGDSEMIVHLSADRTNITVLSIPRDTETELPSCAGGGRGMINSALSYGASCQVAAVVKLTGITIDHFIDFDFSGVIDLSNEVGGVPVCVSAAVHDPYSGLTIGAGTTNVQGKQALQFLRTRDAFYDGSDLGREQATHIFLSSLLRKMKQDATLTNIGEMQSIAETVTQYTTVDNGLDSATALLSLGEDFGKVDSDRVTFLTMPWETDTDQSDPDYYYRVQPSSSAASLFADIETDKSFTTSGGSSATASASASASASGSQSESESTSLSATSGASSGASGSAPSASATISATPNASEEAAAKAHPMHVNVINASGTTQRYETVVSQIFADGFVYTSGSDATATQPSTTLAYSAKEEAAAEELAADLKLPSSDLEETGTGTTLVLSIGTDWTSGATYASAGSSAGTAISVPSDSYEENGANTTACVTANPDFETASSK